MEKYKHMSNEHQGAQKKNSRKTWIIFNRGAIQEKQINVIIYTS